MSEIQPAEGYAVVEDGKINVSTVSETERAAVVNWLVVARNQLVTRSATDEQIAQAFKELRGRAYIAQIRISALP